MISDQILWEKFADELDMNGIELDFHWVPTKTHRIACFSLFPKPTNEDRITIIFSHGNGSDIGHCFGFCFRICCKFRVNVIAYDYSGYGLSGGSPSEKNLYRDAASVWNYTVQQLSIPPDTIILYGNSIGSAASCYLVNCLFNSKKSSKGIVACDKLGGLVIHSGIASGLRIFLIKIKKSPWFDAFCNCDSLAKSKINFPVYILHGKDDRVVPFKHALILRDSIKLEPPMLQTWWVDGADHNNIEMDYANEYYTRMGAFLQICKIKSGKW